MILYVLYMNDDKQDGKSRRKKLQLHIYIIFLFIFFHFPFSKLNAVVDSSPFARQ